MCYNLIAVPTAFFYAIIYVGDSMILPKYEKLYDNFIKFYEEKHVCPYHEMSKEQLEDLFYGYVSNNNVEDDYAFSYMMNYIIKRLSGKCDAHTKVDFKHRDYFPLYFCIFDEGVYTVGCNDPAIRFSKLVSINGVNIDKIVSEIKDATAYGVEGWGNFEASHQLSCVQTLYSLPSLYGSESIVYKMVDDNNKEYMYTFDKKIKYDDQVHFFYRVPQRKDNFYYKIKDDTIYLVYNSCINEQCEKSKDVLAILDKVHTCNRIIVDIRGNTGGNSKNNQPILDFLRKHTELEVITLIDRMTFSSGRFMLVGLKDIGTTVIGEQCGTPISCFGNVEHTDDDNFRFRVSTKYFHFDDEYKLHQAKTKEAYEAMPNSMKVTDMDDVDIEIIPTIEDFKNNHDVALEYAMNYHKQKTR